jgi:Na+/H+-dicarboxylate symporter
LARRKKLALHWKILIGLALGVIVGLAVNQFWTAGAWQAMGVEDPAAFTGPKNAALASTQPGAPNEDAGLTAQLARQIRLGTVFAGQLFLNGLKFIAVPIVLFSLIVGVSSLNDTSRLGRIGGKTIGIYLATTALAITIGLIAANLIGPGRGFDQAQRDALVAAQEATASAKITDANRERGKTAWDVVLDIVPTNPFGAMAEGNTLQVVVAALLVGVAITMLPREKARPLIVFFDAMTEVVIKIVEMILIIAPYAVFALIVVVVADLGVEVLVSLLKYSGVVVFGLAIMMFAVYPGVLRLATPVGYRRFFRAISPAQLLAFSSSSSGATLPVTMECCEERLGVKEEIGSFVLPIGATINMDGTALYQGVAAVFIAQLYGTDLTIGQQLQIVLTATLASIGTAAVPGVGIVMLVIVLESVNIPLEGIAVILGIDRILDMCRTSVNVTGDCMVAAVVAHSEGALLSEEEVDRLTAQREAKGLDEFTQEDEARQRAAE